MKVKERKGIERKEKKEIEKKKKKKERKKKKIQVLKRTELNTIDTGLTHWTFLAYINFFVLGVSEAIFHRFR